MIRFGINDTITNLQGWLQHESEDEKKEDNSKLLTKPLGITIMLLAGIVIPVFAINDFQDGSFMEGLLQFVFGAIFLCAGIIIFLRVRIDRKVARYMRKSSTAVKKEDEPLKEIVKSIPPFDLDIYEQNELPELTFNYAKTVSAERNILNLKPVRILFFYNFYSSTGEVSKSLTLPGFTRLGTVYFLGSPTDISMFNTFSLHIKKKVDSLLITTEEKLKERLQAASDDVLPPGSKQLISVPHFTGAYPEHIFLCTDNIWQQAVKELMNKANIVMVDASDYNTKRSGLNWEFQQLIDNVSTANFIVLINKYTDLPALGEALKKAWKSMSIHSPNNIAEPAALKIVRLEKTLLTTVPEKFSELAPHLKRKNFFSSMGNQLLQSYFLECLQNDKIFGLLYEGRDADHN